MINKKILLLSTYPIQGILTGGPLRVRALVEAYEKKFASVKHVAIFSQHHHPADFSETDIAVAGELAAKTEHAPNTSDFLIGQGIATDSDLRARVTELLLGYRPDIIEIEQVFPYIGLREILPTLPFKPKLVFSSHNVEFSMKQEIMEGLGHSASEITAVVAGIRDAEVELAKKAAALFVCTKEDGETYKKLGAKNYTIARNGVDAIKASTSDVEYWQQYFADRGITKAAVFIGSAHPPNIRGFQEMIGLGMGFLPAGHAIILAGAIGRNIMESLDQETIEGATCKRRLFDAGRPSVARLHGLIAASEVLLLPVVEGGGSNLKTAEALVAHKKIVATHKALRSFDEFADYPTIEFADDADEFRAAILKQLDAPEPKLTEQDREKTNALLWKNCLQPMVEEVATL